jgi:hypothetical protein
MAEFSIRSESVDVEQIMKQIRGRIAEKRGVDYTEEQIRELANVRLEKFLDPKNLRSDLLEQFKRSRPTISVDPASFQAPYTLDDQTLFTSHRAPLRFIRRLLLPVLKLFFNPNTLNQILYNQSQFNVDLLKRDATRRIERAEWNALYYEVLHNVVLETTRMSIEVKNLKMRVESLSSRLDFSERRVRALEGVVQYRPEAMRPRERREALPEPAAGAETEGVVAEGLGGETLGLRPEGDGATRRRRRRRRGRRGAGQSIPGAVPVEGASETSAADHAEANESDDSRDFGGPEGDGFDDEGPETDDTSSPDEQ